MGWCYMVLFSSEAKKAVILEDAWMQIAEA